MPQQQQTSTEPKQQAGPRLLAWAQSDLRLGLAVFVLALLVRLLYYEPLTQSAFFKYPFQAAHYLQGEGEATRAFTCSPLYLYYWVFVARALGGSLALGGLLQMAIGAGSCALIALLGKRFFSPAAGLLAGAAAALYLPFIVHDASYLSEPLVVFLNCLSLWSLYRYREGARWGLPVGGLLLGLSAAARPNGLLLAPFFGLWAVGLIPSRPVRKLGLLALFGLAVLLPPGAVTARNWAVSRCFVPVMSDGGIVAYLGNNALDNGFMYVWPRYEDLFFVRRGEVDPTHRIAHEIAERETGRRLSVSEAGAYWTDQALAFIRGYPAEYPWLVARKLAYNWTGFEGHDVSTTFDKQDALRGQVFLLRFTAVAPLGLLGAVVFWRRRRDLLPLYGLLVVYSVTAMLLTVVARYRIPMVPALLWLGSAAVLELGSRLRRRDLRALALPLLAVLCLTLAMSYRNYAMRALDAQYRVERDYLGTAQGALRSGDFARARINLEQTIAARATFVTVCSAHALLGLIERTSGNTAAATEHEAIARGYVADAAQPDLLLPPPALADDPLAVLWQQAADTLRANRPTEARRQFARLCNMSPTLAPLRHCLGLAYLREGRTAEGLRQLRLARMKDPRILATHRLIVEYGGDRAALRAEYEQLCRTNPDQPGFRSGLELARSK